MRRCAFLLLAALAGLPACGADTGEGLEAFGEVAEDREEAKYRSFDHPRADIQLHLREDGTFHLAIRNLKGSMMKVEEEEVSGTWRIDEGLLQLESETLTASYRQEPVPVDIPGYSGELRGLSWEDGSEKFFATGFDLADDVEMEDVERQIFGG